MDIQINSKNFINTTNFTNPSIITEHQRSSSNIQTAAHHNLRCLIQVRESIKKNVRAPVAPFKKGMLEVDVVMGSELAIEQQTGRVMGN